MYTRKYHEFETQAEAQKFADGIRDHYKSSPADVYITGPRFVEIAKVFKGMEWVMENKDDYWYVSYEVYK
jgi:hypothetical protein